MHGGDYSQGCPSSLCTRAATRRNIRIAGKKRKARSKFDPAVCPTNLSPSALVAHHNHHQSSNCLNQIVTDSSDTQIWPPMSEAACSLPALRSFVEIRQHAPDKPKPGVASFSSPFRKDRSSQRTDHLLPRFQPKRRESKRSPH